MQPLQLEMITTALQFKIFDFLTKSTPLDKLVKQLQFSPKNTKIFLDGLVHLKLLKHTKKGYKNKRFSSTYFVTSSEYYFGDMFLYKKDYIEKYTKNISSLIKYGLTEKINTMDQALWKEVSQQYFYQEQKALFADFVNELIQSLPEYSNIKHILDVGCSSGILSLEFLKNNDNTKATLFDFKEVIDEVKKNIKAYNLQNRVSTLHGDIQKAEIKGKYDLVICSNILHLLPQKEEVVQKIHQVLNKNGVLLVLQTYNKQEALKDKQDYFYNALSMMLGQEILDHHTFSNLILNSGFRNINSFISSKTPHLDTKVYIIKKY